ncbi:MAG: hypothetical protein GX220_08955 [Treponema sp.]|nr:hypothetical protein [Treponema sp.]
MKNSFLLSFFIILFINNQYAYSENNNDEIIKKDFSFLNSDKRLRMLNTIDEKFLLNNFENSFESLIKVSDEKVVKKIFDSKMRLKKEIFWTEDVLSLIKEYFYEDEVLTPSLINEQYLIEKKINVSKFNYAGLLLSLIEYEIYETENKKENKEISKKILNYDENNNLLEIIFQKKDFNSLQKYIYNEGYDYPDEKFYENNVLVREKKYINNEKFVEIIYFEGSMKVEKYFENENKFLEIYFVNGIETRRKNF